MKFAFVAELLLTAILAGVTATPAHEPPGDIPPRIVQLLAFADPAPTPPAPTPPAPIAPKVVVTGPVSVDPGKPMLFDATGTVADSIEWQCLQPQIFFLVGSSNLQAVAFDVTGEATHCSILVAGFNKDGSHAWRAWETQIAQVAPPNPPNPPAPPNPNPPAPPVTGPLWVITFDDESNRTPETGAILGDMPFWNSVRAGGDKPYQFDIGNTQHVQPYTKWITQAGGAPCLIFMDSTKTVRDAMSLRGKTKADIQAALNKLKGK